MRILILGAGVIGSFNAARLTRAGQDITLLARGRRLADLREHGVVLEDLRTGRSITTRVRLVDGLGPEDAYDLAIVTMKRNQLPPFFRYWRKTTASRVCCSWATTRLASRN